MACKYIFNGVEYKDKQTFIEEFVRPNFINQPKTLRVQEYQSDEFQKLFNNFSIGKIQYTKGKDLEGKVTFYKKDKNNNSNFGGEYISRKEYEQAWEKFLDNYHPFLAILHRNDNWQTFGIKAIIQNAAKQGFSKILFPTGNTASKVEGHTTLEEFKKQKEDRIKQIEKGYDETIQKLKDFYLEDVRYIKKDGKFFKQNAPYVKSIEIQENEFTNVINTKLKETKDNNEVEITQLKQELERVEGPEGFGALKPIWNFYENTVTNILNKTYGKENVKVITDEFGNTWNEISLNSENVNPISFIEKDLNDLLDKNNKEEIFNITETNEDTYTIGSKYNQNVNYSAINNTLFFNDSEINFESNVNDILFNIINCDAFKLTNESKILFDKALNLFDKSGAKVKIVSEENFRKMFKSQNALMAYDHGTNSIYMYKEAFGIFTPYTMLHAFVHETAHSTTVHLYRNPKTQEHRDFKKFVDENFQYYKNLFESSNLKEKYTTSDYYGFTDELEFIAESYSNPVFQKILKELSELDGKKSFIEKLADFLRRLFNRPLNSETKSFYNNLILLDEINKFVETDRSGFKGVYNNKFATDDFSFIEKPKEDINDKYKLNTIDKKIDHTINDIKDSIEINLGKYNKIKRKLKGERKEKVQAYVDILKELLIQMNGYSEADRWKSIIAYTNSLSKNVESLNTRFNAEDFSNENMLGIIRMYSNYLNSYSLIDNIINLVSDLKVENQDVVSKEEIDDISENLTRASGIYRTLESNFNSALKSGLKKNLSNIKYITQIETDWRQKLEKEYKDLGLKEPKEPWISKQMNTVYKDQIQADVETYVNDLIDSPAFDITTATGFFNSSINTNSKLITIFQTMLDEIRNNIIKQVSEKDFRLSKLHEDLVKEKGSSDVLKLYKNLIEFDGEKPILKGKYSIKYKIDKQALSEKLQSIKAMEGSSSDEYKKIKALYDNVKLENYKIDNSNLSSIEKKVLKEFQDIIDKTHESTFGISSLKNYYSGATFYNLPAITKSDLERSLSGDIKGVVKDKVTDLTKIKTDDVGYDYSEKSIDIAGNPIYNIKVMYRGQISPKDQSMDLFTIMRLEYINGVTYKEKHEKELELNAIVEIAKTKDYFRTEGIRTPVISRYANRNRLNLKSGIESNTYKRLHSMMESNIYNISNKYAGSLGPIDLNKAIKFTNGMTAQISLAINPFSAVANVLNGKAQMFLEGVSKNVIDFKNLKKAETIYLGDLGNNMQDLGRPIKKSFTNQMNIMFDSFGTISIGNQAFIKNNLAKTMIDPHQLQFMHEGGEHWMQSTLTMAVLDSVKVMNENNDFIDKEGKIVDSKDKAASLLDMLKLNDKTGKLEVDDKVVYTTHTYTTKYNEGGNEHINSLIKKKIFDTMGNYDSNMQPEAMRHWWGKMFLMFRRYLVPMGVARFKGFAYSFKSNEDLKKDPEKYLSYSHSLKDYEEGMYTSFVRLMKFGILPSIKQLQLSLTEDYWKSLSDSQKGNIKKAVTEISLTFAMLPLLGMLLGAMKSGDDDDDKWIYFLMYEARRLESDLAQYRNISENFKLIRSPIPSVRLLESASNVIYKTLQPWSWDDRYEAGKRKGDLKYFRDWEKLIPVLNKLDVTAEDLYKFQDSKFGMN